MGKHTPGPWKGMDAWNPPPREDIGDGEQYICLSLIRAEDGTLVLRPNPFGYSDVYIRAADAPVLLSAPDLLAALEAVWDWLLDVDYYVPQRIKNNIEAAIKKARGE